MAKNWVKLFKKYKGLWVALKDDEETVVGVGKTAKEAWLRAQESRYTKPILTHIPEKLISYIGYN